MNVKIKKLYEDAIIPTRGSEYAAGLDLYAYPTNFEGQEIEGVYITESQTRKIGTGIAIAIPEGYFGAVFARSGLATNNGLRPANCVGVVDSDYRGEIIVALHNDKRETQKVSKGDRIAQLIIIPYQSISLEEVEKLEETAREACGFGSTGK